MSSTRHLYDPFDSELCLIGAANDTLLPEAIKQLINFLERAPDVPLQEVAYTCAHRAKGKAAVLAVVAKSTGELLERLTQAHKKLTANGARIRDKSGTYYFKKRLAPTGRIAFLFPGVTSFYPDMLRDLCIVFNDCRATLGELEEALQPTTHGDFHPSSYIFPPCYAARDTTSATGNGSFYKSLIAVHVVNMAFYRLFSEMRIAPDGLLGFSGGDFSAMEAAGVYGNLSRQKRVVYLRESYRMLSSLVERGALPDCIMLALIDASPELQTALTQKWPGRLVIAAYHSPRQCTIAFSPDIKRPVSTFLNTHNIKNMVVPIERPFNTPWCSRALPTIKQFLAPWTRHAPRVPIYSCASAEPFPSRPDALQRLVPDQWTSPIRLEATIRKMYADGFRIFVELGPRGNLTNAIDETLKGMPHQAVAVNRIHRSGLTQLHHALGILAAQGVPLDLTALHKHRKQRLLDFKRPLQAVIRTDNEMQLASTLPTLTPFEASAEFMTPSSATVEQERKAMPLVTNRRALDFGAEFPLLANAKIVTEEPGVMMEIAKTLHLDDYPFLRDYAIGTAQLSYANPKLRGLTLLSLASSLEMICEAARKLVPRRRVAQVENLRSQRWMAFERGSLHINLRAERISWPNPQFTAVRVQLRDDTPNSAFTWPIVEATVLLTTAGCVLKPNQPEPLTNARPVNWVGHDIYPDRLFHGKHLQIIRHVDLWSEGGIDFEVEVPGRAEAVRYTRIPLFSIWPMLLDGIVSSFSLWRAHERFAGAISLPFRARRITFYTATFTEGARLRGYLRLVAVTPRSHVADIMVSDGNGNLLIHLRGWEELCERVPPEYHQYILRPSEKYLTRELTLELLGSPTLPASASYATDIPFKIFEGNQELWLESLANVLLAPVEREEWTENQGTVNRRAEWLFGRAAAKEATRRFLLKYHQARWTGADIPIWPDVSGKPHPLGPWREHATTTLDLSISHTAKLIVAAVIANARIGIDIEILGRTLSEDFTKGVFTPEELELAAHSNDSPTAILRFWCAKEAISKALGIGIRYSPQDLRVVSADMTTGIVAIELMGQWLESFKQMKGLHNPIHTTLYEGHAMATSILPLTLFNIAP